MKRGVKTAVVAIVVVAAALARSGPAGASAVCVNAPSVYGGNIDDAAVDAVLALRPECVRVNVRQDVWSSIADTTPHGRLALGLLGTYDALVNRFVAAGVEVYVLVHAEAVNRAAEDMRTAAGLDAYATAFVQIVDHFRDRVTTYEAFNEPNNWVRPSFPALDEPAFARLLARVYRDVRMAHRGDPCWNVRIVSGALFAFDQPGGASNDGATYLAETYRQGIATAGWDAIRAATGSYPLDGVGYHFYFGVETTAATQTRLRAFLDGIWAAVTRYEGVATTKQLWISEFGWQSANTAASDADQARELDAAYDVLSTEPRVAMAMWFTFQDFGAGTDEWGLYRETGFRDSDARPARDRFRAQADAHRPALRAVLSAMSVPATMAAGSTATVRVRASNSGTASWGTGYRLGAGPGCSTTARANSIAWTAFPSGGYAMSLTDARVFVNTGTSVTPGANYDFVWGLTAPAATGPVHLVARMVHEGVAWFGMPMDATIVVTPGTAGDAGVRDAALDAAIDGARLDVAPQDAAADATVADLAGSGDVGATESGVDGVRAADARGADSGVGSQPGACACRVQRDLRRRDAASANSCATVVAGLATFALARRRRGQRRRRAQSR